MTTINGTDNNDFHIAAQDHHRNIITTLNSRSRVGTANETCSFGLILAKSDSTSTNILTI